MKFAFRRPALPCVAIAGGIAHAVVKSAQFDRIVKSDTTRPAYFYDGQGIRYDYIVEAGVIAPQFPPRIHTKKQIMEKVFECANMTNHESHVRTKSLSNIRLPRLIEELCLEIIEAGL